MGVCLILHGCVMNPENMRANLFSYPNLVSMIYHSYLAIIWVYKKDLYIMDHLHNELTTHICNQIQVLL